MEKNNLNLVDYCKNALNQKWYYGWGAVGQKATVELVNSLVVQYKDMNTRWKNYMIEAVNNNNNLCDCYGLVKGFLAYCDTGEVKILGKYDVNTSTAFAKSTKKGPLNTLPETGGVILWMKGHVGVYIGNGRFIECAGGGAGMKEGRIENGKVVKGSRFTNWFYDVNINYIEKNKEEEILIEQLKNEIQALKKQLEDKTLIKKTDFMINDVKKQLDTIMVDSFNYVNLRELSKELGVQLEYSENENLIKLKG